MEQPLPFGQNTAGDTDAPPWMRPDALAELPPTLRGTYGVLESVGKELRPVVVEGEPQLHSLIQDASLALPLVLWTASDSYMQTLYEVDSLAATVVERSMEEARRSQRKALPRAVIALAAIGAVIAFWPESRNLQALVVLAAIFLLPVFWDAGLVAWFDGWRDRRRLASEPDAWRTDHAAAVRFAIWRAVGGTLTGRALIACCVAVFVLTLSDRSQAIEQFALVPERVEDGEVWRLFTCALLHANVVHIYFNLTVGASLAAIARSLVSEWRVLLVFLCAVLAGSCASLVVTQGVSVGASGGILGWGGLLAGLGIANRDVRRTGILAGMLRWVGLLALIGIAGAGFIDNAAHAGGFLSGLVLGVIFARTGRRTLPIGGAGLDAPFWALAIPAAAGVVWVLWELVSLRL